MASAEYPPPTEPNPPPPDDGLPPDFVAPGPTSLPANWQDQWYGIDEQPYAIYEVKYGDTLVGITKTYLDPTGARWPEIWELNRDMVPNPDELLVGDQLRMPEEVRRNVKAWIAGDVKRPSDNRGKASTSMYWWLGGGAAVSALALYWMAR